MSSRSPGRACAGLARAEAGPMYPRDPEAEASLAVLAATDQVEVRSLTRYGFEGRIGRLEIRVQNAKVPHGPWEPALHESVLEARRSYWETWGQIPLDDEPDEHAYVDVAWVWYPDERRNGSAGDHLLVEGVTTRTVYIDCPGTQGEEGLPDDLRFWIGRDGTPLLDLMAERLYAGDRLQARRKLVVGSRLASLRPPGRKHNLYTPEGYAAVQLVAAARAIQDGAEFFVNTMREEMTANVLSLPDGSQYQHFRTESRLGIRLDSIRLNRADPFVFGHMCNYPGYFTNTGDFVGLVERLLAERGPGFEKLLREALGVDPTGLPSLKASRLKVFTPLLVPSGRLNGRFSTDEFRELVQREVGDGPRSYTMPVRERLGQAVKILSRSPIVRRGEHHA